MKGLKILLMMASMPVFLQVQAQEKEPFLTKTFDKETIKNVVVKTSGGSIEVNGGNEGKAKVEVYVQANNGNGKRLSQQEIKERLSDYNLDISVDNQKLSAIAKPKGNNINWKRGLSISFKVFVPKSVSTDLNTSGGSIHLSNLSGQQSFKTSGGSLHVEKVTGDISGKTSGGSIHVSDSRDNINLETSGGSIRASNCGGTIKLKTAGGSLNLEDLNGSIHATTSGGSVKADNIKGELITGTSGGSMNLSNLACSLETSTASGSVHVQLAQLGKYVKIHSGGGHVDLQIPGGKGMDLSLKGNKVSASGLSNFKGSKEEDRIDGELNGGGTPVEVNVSGGNVSLTVQ
ncbi:hypothetical protein [Rubrolithibacter danxiaensis]|uniref:hypothetical protein n=1 Tax=Rubrolithibacter danxiaensis TaxID=3390805 RepID=UPI003BF854A6